MTIVDRITLTLPYVLTLGCGGLLIFCAIRGEPFNVSGEDGWLEWSTVYFMGVGFILALCALFFDRTLKRPQRIFLVVLAVGLLLAAGEEVSWGQRIFDWEVPDSMTKESGSLIQAGHGDTALHNLSFRSKYLKFSIGGVLFGVVLLGGLFIHGIWLPRAEPRDHPRARWLVDRLGVFVPPLDLGVMAFVAALVFHFSDSIDSTQSREYKEFILPVLLAFMLVQSFYKQNRPARTGASAALLVLTAVWVVGSVVLMTRTS